MIEHVIIPNIQYVDGLPSEGQRRISWIENGEQLNGAKTRFGNDGELNRVSVELQKNIVTLDLNDLVVASKLNETIDVTNELYRIVTDGTGADLNERVTVLETDVANTKLGLEQTNNSLVIIRTSQEALQENVGYYDPNEDTVHRSLREDDVFLKQQLGNWPDEDMNGRYEEGTETTGIKGKITTLLSESSSQNTRISAIETKISVSGIETLAEDVALIRTELGTSSAMEGKDKVFDRLNSMETSQQEIIRDINTVNDAIDVSNPITLSSRVSTSERDIQSVTTKVSGENGLEFKVQKITEKIGSPGTSDTILGNIEYLDADIEKLNREIGLTDAEGLRKKVADASDSANQANTKASQVETGLISTNANVSELQTEIGDSSSGIKSSVLNLSTKMNGTVGPSGSTVDEKGVYEASKLNFTAVQGIQSEMASLDSSFGALTIRVNGIDTKATNADTKATTATQDVVALRGRVETAETKVASLDTEVKSFDGRITVSTNKLNVLEPKVEKNITDIADLTVTVKTLIPEAPKDGKPYVRIDGTWVLLESLVDLKA